MDVSVIVPVFNRADVIGQAVNSLLQQEFARPYEIIVVDDGSTDGTPEVVGKIDPRVRVVVQEKQGAAVARRTGIERAEGKAIAFLDSDDIARPDHLRLLWDGLHSNPCVALSFSRRRSLGGRVVPYRDLKTLLEIGDNGIVEDPLVAALRYGCLTASMTLMTYRWVALRASEGRTLSASNDYDFCLRAALNGQFYFVDHATVLVERRDDGISRKLGSRQAGNSVVAAVDAVRQSGRQDKAVRAALSERVQQVWAWAFTQYVREHEWQAAFHIAMLGIRHAPWFQSARKLWWAINEPRPVRSSSQ